jgi:D-alanyl-D-alanine carboxypeptidase
MKYYTELTNIINSKSIFMKQVLKFSSFIFFTLFFSCNIYGQLTDDYAAKIDSLIQTTSPRSFNGVILICPQNSKKYEL